MLCSSPLRCFSRTAIMSSPRTARRLRPAAQLSLAADAAATPATPKSQRAGSQQSTAGSTPAGSEPSPANAAPRSPKVGVPVRRKLSLAFNDSADGGASDAAPEIVISTPSSLAASVDAVIRTADLDGEWGYALKQLKRLLPASERLAPWQQHSSLLLCCAEAALKLGEAFNASSYALDAVDLHVAVSADAASVHARVIAARALDKTGRRTEAAEFLLAACNLVESSTASAEQTSSQGRLTEQLDAGLPFLEYARLLESCGSDAARLEALQKAVARQGRATKRTITAAYALLARTYAATKQLEEADRYFTLAVASAPSDAAKVDALAEAAFFAQHSLRSVDRAVLHYEQLFQLRPAAIVDGLEPNTERCSKVAEQLLNAGVCYEQHPQHGCAKAVGLYRAALSHLPPNSTCSYRLRLYLARAYAGSGQIDRAVEEYESIVKHMTNGREDVVQIDVNGMRGYLPLCEVYGHLALCLFQRASDPSGALTVYHLAFEAAKAGTTGANGKTRVQPSNRLLEWLHEGLGALCLRLGRFEEAVAHLEEKIEYAAARNDGAADAHLHIACAYESLHRADDAAAVYKHLFDLPITATTRENRLELTLRYAWLSHYTLGDYTAAVTLYLAALHVDADNPHTMVQAAWCMLQLPEFDVAEVEALYVSAALAVEVAKQEPAAAAQWDECYVLGECAVFHHDFTKKAELAEELYVAALKATNSDNYAQVAANYAVFLHYEKKESDEAMRYFEAAIAAKPKLPAAVTLFADFLIHTNQLDRAVQELTGLLETNRLEAWHKLARIAERVAVDNSYDAAAATYCRALGAPDDLEDASDDAILDIFRALQPAQLPAASDLLLMLHYKARRVPLVEKLYDLVLATFPHEAQLHMHHAKFNMDLLKRKKGAHAAFRRAIRLDPGNVTVLDHYAEFLSNVYPDRLEVAEAVHLQSVRLNPSNPQAHFSYASFLTYVYKAPQRAEEHFKAALQLDPHDSVTLCCYASFLETQAEARGRAWEYYAASLDYAERMHREAQRLSPTNASHCIFFANFMWRQRRHAEAWGALQQALQLEPGNATTLRLAGIFLHDWCVVRSHHHGGGSSSSDSRSASNMTTAHSGARSGSGHHHEGFGSAGGDNMPDQPTLVHAAAQAFKKSLAIAPQDAVTLRAYARFLEDVQRDPHTAATLEAAAVELELAEHDAALSAAGEERKADGNDDGEDGDGSP
jgi:tetratricopeptide (TPR) repeat protein